MVNIGREAAVEQIAELIADFANGASKRDIALLVKCLTRDTHRTIQQNVMKLVVALIEAWAENAGGSDLRNEATVKLCKRIVEATGDTYDRALPCV